MKDMSMKGMYLSGFFRIFAALFLCMNIPFITNWYALSYISQDVVYKQKGMYLMGFARALDTRLGPGGYDEILRQAEAADAAKDKKIEILNTALSEATDDIALSHPGLGAGFYSKELDVIITYGPSAEFGKYVAQPIPADHPGRDVMRTGKELLSKKTLVRGPILNAQHPVIRQDKIIGYIWVNETLSNIENDLAEVTQWIFFILAVIYITTLIVTSVVFYRTIAIERKISALAQSANDAQKTFLAHMSHEIRTPLNGVIGITDLLKKTDITPKQQEYLGLLSTSSLHLLAIINDILDFSKIEAGKLEIEQVEFMPVAALDTVIKIVMPRAMEKDIELTCTIDKDIPCRLLGDMTRLRQILINFLNNALKYTEKGSIHLKAEKCRYESTGIHEAQNCTIRFSVADTGVGIPQDRQGKLFNAFSQIDVSDTRKFGGTGLGLAIAKALVVMMSGKIGVISQEGVGSTFWCEIPFMISDMTTVSLDSAVSPYDSIFLADLQERMTGKILVAEDNHINQIVLGEILSQAGFQYDIVNNGLEAVETVQKENYAIVLMDCQMPVLDGYEATRRIRQLGTDAAKHLPIVALTASATKDDQAECFAAGMNGFTTKPIAPDTLMSIIKKFALMK